MTILGRSGRLLFLLSTRPWPSQPTVSASCTTATEARLAAGLEEERRQTTDRVDRQHLHNVGRLAARDHWWETERRWNSLDPCGPWTRCIWKASRAWTCSPERNSKRPSIYILHIVGLTNKIVFKAMRIALAAIFFSPSQSCGHCWSAEHLNRRERGSAVLCRVAVLFRRQDSLSQSNNNRKMDLLFCRARARCRMGQLNWRMNCGSTFPVSIQNNAATGKILSPLAEQLLGKFSASWRLYYTCV